MYNGSGCSLLVSWARFIRKINSFVIGVPMRSKWDRFFFNCIVIWRMKVLNHMEGGYALVVEEP